MSKETDKINIMEKCMVEIKTTLKHIEKTISEIQSKFEKMDNRISILEANKLRLQGVGIALSSGLTILAIKMFFN